LKRKKKEKRACCLGKAEKRKKRRPLRRADYVQVKLGSSKWRYLRYRPPLSKIASEKEGVKSGSSKKRKEEAVRGSTYREK